MSEEEKKAVGDLKLFLDKKENYLTDKELQIVLNLMEKQENKLNETKHKLEEQIQFCNGEKSSSENNHICYLSVGFYEKLLDIINREKKDESR